LGLFDQLLAADLFRPDLAARVGSALLDEGRIAEAVEALVFSDQVLPGQKVIRPILQVVRKHRPRVLLVRGDEASASELGDFIGARFDLTVTESTDRDELRDRIAESPIVWLEGANAATAVAGSLPAPGLRIVHLDRYDPDMGWLEEMRWDAVDILLVPSESAGRAIAERFEALSPSTQVYVVPDGLDLDGLELHQAPVEEQRIGVYGMYTVDRSPHVLDFFAALAETGADHTLHLVSAGDYDPPRAGLRQEVISRNIGEQVRINQSVQDTSWLADVGWLVTDARGAAPCHVLLEAMARGVKPIVCLAEGETCWLDEEFTARSAEEFVRRITRDAHEPERYRKMVAGEFGLRLQLARINAVLMQAEASLSDAL
jgi:glycosyltransferase involved in cell wall biosynthesis